ncbi:MULTISPECIES: hypothetical protein [unclassified Microbacterium]|uniref:hypothetical protein n=1 Tax=unclassified Microbacterium TaxID=2609290 RepID=UPI0011AFB737|nr:MULTISPECIES: hypothetical protein [unclassified Microbacterium]
MTIDLAFPAGEGPDFREVADWCEYTALTQTADFKRGDLKSAISRENISSADLLEEQAWAELTTRAGLFGATWPLELDGSRLRRAAATEDARTLYRYLCLLGMGQLDNVDRKLFEEIVRAIFAVTFGENTMRIGHPASAGMSTSFRERAKHYATAAGLTSSEYLNDPLPDDKDLGLDVVSWHGTGDNRGGELHFLVQCATGKNWPEKGDDIHLGTISPHLNWAVTPVRVFCIPAVAHLPEQQWIRFCRRAGLVLDRPRLIEAGTNIELSDALRTAIHTREVALVG